MLGIIGKEQRNGVAVLRHGHLWGTQSLRRILLVHGNLVRKLAFVLGGEVLMTELLLVLSHLKIISLRVDGTVRREQLI